MIRILFVILLLPLMDNAQLQLAEIFSDHMLLQRDKPVCVWGTAVPGKTVIVTLAKETGSATVRPDSTWRIYLKAKKADSGPQQLLVRSGADSVLLRDILIGDVWVCIGQSNMEWPMNKELNYLQEISNSNNPALRFYNPGYAGKNIFGVVFTDSVAKRLTPGKFYNGVWQRCDSNSFKNMSAVAYYFGKEVTAKTTVPVGLINLSIGGAPLETFIDKSVLTNSSRFAKKVKGDWLTNTDLPVWVRERGMQNTLSLNSIPADENGKNHAFKPGFAYAAGIKLLLPMPVKGILCYQGESNAQETERVKEYAALSKLMVDDYRKKWNDPQLPFYFVQLSSIDTVKYKGHLWPEFRDEQRKMLQLITESGMAVCSDIGARDDVHPVNKKEVGLRLARWALNKTYHQKIIPSGPLPLKAVYTDGEVLVTFQHRAKGLKTADGSELNGFSVDGKNPARAIFNKKGIGVICDRKPEFIYYGWTAYSNGNLVNSEGLPASTFKINVQ